MLGNWVYDGERTQFPMQVVGIGKDYVYLDFEGNEGDLWESTPEDLQGIPITKEMLEKIGFEERTLGKGVNGGRDWVDYIFRPESYKLAVCDHGEYVCDKKWHVHIDNADFESLGGGYFTCLHELQNLVKIITGQELKINL